MLDDLRLGCIVQRTQYAKQHAVLSMGSGRFATIANMSKKPTDQRVSFIIPAAVIRAVDIQAEKTNRTRSGMLRQLIVDATSAEIVAINKIESDNRPAPPGVVKRLDITPTITSVAEPWDEEVELTEEEQRIANTCGACYYADHQKCAGGTCVCPQCVARRGAVR